MRVVVARALTLALASLVPLVAPACGGGDGLEESVGIDLSIEPTPPAVGPASITLALTGADGEPLAGATVEVEGTMSHAGMVPVFGTAEEQDPGVYVAPLEFTMGGDWILIVDAMLSDGRKLKRNLEVRDVRWKRDS
jgi:hypothetical protein